MADASKHFATQSNSISITVCLIALALFVLIHFSLQFDIQVLSLVWICFDKLFLPNLR